MPELAIAVRMNATDSVPSPYGFGVPADGSDGIDLGEPKRLAGALRDAGCSLINVSAGIPTYGPQVGRPFDRPVAGTAPSPEHPLVGVMRLLALGVGAFSRRCRRCRSSPRASRGCGSSGRTWRPRS